MFQLQKQITQKQGKLLLAASNWFWTKFYQNRQA